jgi:hypothetical protein
LNGFGFATSGPAIDGVVIAVEAGASGAGATTGGGGGGTNSGCCADAETVVPNTQAAATARVAALLGNVVREIRFIGFFPLTKPRSSRVRAAAKAMPVYSLILI